MFKDLNANGHLDAYEDWRLEPSVRSADLVHEMSIEELVGLMAQASLRGFTGPNGELLRTAPAATEQAAGASSADPDPSTLLLQRNIRWILVRPQDGERPHASARFANELQEMAETSRLGVPVVLTSDSRHTARRDGTNAFRAPDASRWSDPLGIAATRDPALAKAFGSTVRDEFRALGLRAFLGPMADLATEPRWSRVANTFGEDPALASTMTAAFVEGLQGPRIAADSVLAFVKHFPGDGPVRDGIDPHEAAGRFLVYPAGRLESHLDPFRAAISAGTAGVMLGYGIPSGIDTVGAAFSHAVTTDLLRGQLGFPGIVLTDWLRDMPWGVEDKSPRERQQLVVAAGVDQLGGENSGDDILSLVRGGTISRQRVEQSAQRILEPMFALGIFENPYVNAAAADDEVRSPAHVAAGRDSQSRSLVLLKNADAVLPFSSGHRVYAPGFDAAVVRRFGTVVRRAEDADVAIVRLYAPYQVRVLTTPIRRTLHGGTLDYPDAANHSELDELRRVSGIVRTVACIHLDRPAILTDVTHLASAVLVDFNASDEVILGALFGNTRPAGKLPLDLPRSMSSVLAQASDAPHDIANPLYSFGFGLTYPPSSR